MEFAEGIRFEVCFVVVVGRVGAELAVVVDSSDKVDMDQLVEDKKKTVLNTETVMKLKMDSEMTVTSLDLLSLESYSLDLNLVSIACSCQSLHCLHHPRLLLLPLDLKPSTYSIRFD